MRKGKRYRSIGCLSLLEVGVDLDKLVVNLFLLVAYTVQAIFQLLRHICAIRV